MDQVGAQRRLTEAGNAQGVRENPHAMHRLRCRKANALCLLQRLEHLSSVQVKLMAFNYRQSDVACRLRTAAGCRHAGVFGGAPCAKVDHEDIGFGQRLQVRQHVVPQLRVEVAKVADVHLRAVGTLTPAGERRAG